ncbi:MAG: hypothetical protein QXO69_01670 [archaeon]
MFKAISKTNRIYLSTLNLIVYFSVFIFFSLVLLPLFSSYVNVGGALVRFSSIYKDINPVTALILLLVGLISVLSLSFFISAIVSVVKLRETLDHVKFNKAVSTFTRYVAKVFMFFILLSAASITAGVLLTLLGAPAFLTQLILFIVWIPFMFTPQVLIIEDMGIIDSMTDSLAFVKKFPKALVLYFSTGFVFVLALLLLETFLGQYFVWEHKIPSIILLSLFVVPYLQMLATELYIMRYAVSKT